MEKIMSNVLSKLNDNGLEETTDTLGGSFLLESGAYKATIANAYVSAAKSGALSVTVLYKIDGKDFSETIYVSNRNGENFYLKDKKKIPLPGYTLVNDICLITTEKPLAEQETEEKVVKIFDYTAKTEIPTAMPCLTALCGQEIMLGILKKKEYKNKKNDNTGEYEPIDETREYNSISKVFHPELLCTVHEAKNSKPAEFYPKWVEKNEGVTVDLTKGKTPKASGSAPLPFGNTTTATPAKSSLFN